MQRRHVLRLVVLLVVVLAGAWYRSVQHAPVPAPESSGSAQHTGSAPAAGTTTESASPRAGDRRSGPPGTAPSPISHPEIGFGSDQALIDHFAKHGAEFGVESSAEYLGRAQALRDGPAGGDVIEVVRADGVICRFDRASGAFLAFNRDRTIRTFFRPNDGEAYFRRQLAREH
jgi:hypothetical protein